MSTRVSIVSRIYRPEPSAASFFLGAVSDALTSQGHDVAVTTVRPPSSLRDRVHDHERETVRRLPVLRDREGYVRGYLPYMSFDIPLIFRLLCRRRPSVIFVEPPPTTGAVVRVIAGLRRIPYVYDAADIWSDAADMATGSQLVIRVLRMIERFAMRGAAEIVTISPEVADRLRAFDVTRPVTVTGFGADTAAFTVLDHPAEKLFVYAGSYSAWHGADVIVDAFADFSSTHPGYRLRVIGNGTERSTLEDRAQALGVADAIEFHEPVPPAELNQHLAPAVATIATLKPETGYDYAFATKTYSSLAAGCPVIFAGPGPTAPFLVGANRHVRAGAATPYSAAAIATAMRTFADAPLDLAARNALHDWVDAEHSLCAVAHRVALRILAVGERKVH